MGVGSGELGRSMASFHVLILSIFMLGGIGWSSLWVHIILRVLLIIYWSDVSIRIILGRGG